MNPAQASCDEFESLVYPCVSSKPPVPSNVLSMTQLKTMDLQDQVKALLINGEFLAVKSQDNYDHNVL